MGKGRLEAFSDGVIAILITVMVLDLHVPQGGSLADLRPLLPLVLSYALSFVFLAIYWNNHHHLFQAVEQVSGGVLWANAHLLFWLSLVPFTTAWIGQEQWAPWPIALYGVDLLLCGVAYYILARALIAREGQDSTIAAAIGRDRKGKISLLVYMVAIPCAFYHPGLSYACYVAVACLWLVPDRRIERALEATGAARSER